MVLIMRSDNMRVWKYENIIVYERLFNSGDIFFDVYIENEYLYSVFPNTFEEANACIKRLDLGINPLTDLWEEGEIDE